MTNPAVMPRHMQIAICTYGSRGDVEPFVALGAALSGAGHSVRILAPAPFGNLVQAHGLSFTPLEGDPDQLMLSFADQARLSWPRMIARMIQHVLPLAATVFRTLERGTRDADLIIHSFLMTDAGHTLAGQRGVPDVSAQLFPVFLPSSAFPAVGLPDLPLGAVYRRATHALNASVFRIGGRLLYRKVRASAPDLPGLAPWPFGHTKGVTTPVLLAYSPRVLPRPADWPVQAHVTGYWHLNPPQGWVPPEALLQFMNSGPPPIYFGVGSVRTRRMSGLLQDSVQAILSTGQRAVLSLPPDARGRTPESPRLFHAVNVPHEWLFPRMRFIIHHGGAGTTGAAIRAGVPSAAIPFTADQAFWARRIHRLGLGPAAPPAHRLTPRRLVSIIEQALDHPSYHLRASTLGEEVRLEDGVGTAVRLIHEHLGAAS